MPFKVYFRSEFVPLFFPQSRKILKENHPFTRLDSYGHSINALVTKYHCQKFYNLHSAGTFTSHAIFTRTLWDRFDSLHTTEETQALENSVLCSISQAAPQLTKNTELLCVPQKHEWLLLYGDHAKLQFSFFCKVHELSVLTLCWYTVKWSVSFRENTP